MGRRGFHAFLRPMAFLTNEVSDSNRRYDDKGGDDDYNRELVRERFLLVHGREFPRWEKVVLKRQIIDFKALSAGREYFHRQAVGDEKQAVFLLGKGRSPELSCQRGKIDSNWIARGRVS